MKLLELINPAELVLNSRPMIGHKSEDVIGIAVAVHSLGGKDELGLTVGITDMCLDEIAYRN